MVNEYYDALDQINPSLYTCSQIKDYLLNYSKSQSCLSVGQRWQAYIDELHAQKRKGTAGLHELSLRYFKEKFDDITLIAFSQSNVMAFEKYLFQDKKLNSTTTGMHMKRLKVIINAAIKDGMVQYKVNPFAYYTLPEVQERNLDITVEELRQIRDFKTDSKPLTIARDLFMLSYYLGGINLIDLLQINFSNMRTITYVRQKTASTKRGNKEIRLSIPKEALPIIQRWISIDGTLKFDYAYSYDNFRKYIARQIKRLAEELNIQKRVVYYSARKSFVQHGFELGIPLEVLEYSIGQSIKKNRPIFNYIRFMQSYADQAIRLIIDNLNNPKEKEYPSFMTLRNAGF
ncbi:MAG: tyrosine-type recombinase/integrase, partial [Bacteroides sp.]